MTTYYISHGPSQIQVASLKEAREEAKRISRRTLYTINIIANGDVVETWCPKIRPNGTVHFLRVKP